MGFGYGFFFCNLTCYHFIFLMKCVYSVPDLHFWIRELVVVTLHPITEVSQECDPCWFFNKKKGISVDLRCDGKDIKKMLT